MSEEVQNMSINSIDLPIEKMEHTEKYLKTVS